MLNEQQEKSATDTLSQLISNNYSLNEIIEILGFATVFNLEQQDYKQIDNHTVFLIKDLIGSLTEYLKDYNEFMGD